MIRPLSKDERRAWQLGTEDIATNARGFVSAEVLAMNRQRYESTLQAKDEQIKRLVEGVLAVDEWTSGRPGHFCPFCFGLIPNHNDDCVREVAAAIKEATT